jgi:hypothetical protein
MYGLIFYFFEQKTSKSAKKFVCLLTSLVEDINFWMINDKRVTFFTIWSLWASKNSKFYVNFKNINKLTPVTKHTYKNW